MNLLQKVMIFREITFFMILHNFSQFFFVAGVIKQVTQHHAQQIYTRVTKEEGDE